MDRLPCRTSRLFGGERLEGTHFYYCHIPVVLGNMALEYSLYFGFNAFMRNSVLQFFDNVDYKTIYLASNEGAEQKLVVLECYGATCDI